MRFVQVGKHLLNRVLSSVLDESREQPRLIFPFKVPRLAKHYSISVIERSDDFTLDTGYEAIRVNEATILAYLKNCEASGCKINQVGTCTTVHKLSECLCNELR